MMPRWLLLLLVWLPPVSGQALEVVQVGSGVSLQGFAAPAELQRLDIGLVVLDPGVEAGAGAADDVFPEVRRVEAQYLPVLLRQVLQETDAWGVVRVLPEAAVLPELLVSGEILVSDGVQLELRVRAEDATGRLWLQRIYRDQSEAADYPVSADGDPFVDLYRQLANDLLAIRRQLDDSQLREVRRVALLRYAALLSPEAFAGYLAGGQGGELFRVARLPAAGDPMMARVERIRNQEYLFIDTVDEQYLNLYQSLGPTYNLWRQYSREQALYVADYQERVANRKSHGRRGSFPAMQQRYDAYRNLRIQQQDLDEQALGFDNEVAPTVMEASGRVFRLTGTLDSQYGEWRHILREIFRLETGLPGDVR
jgi:hypothetical protein